MPKVINLVGQKFGEWTVLSKGESDNYGTRWNCRCSCGVERLVKSSSLRGGKSVSCGCLRHDNPTNLIHGHNRQDQRTPTYQTWRDMKRRCEDEKHRNYKTYGGKGVRVCNSWQKFANFLRDMGERPKGMTLDRVDRSGNYTSDNCRWATPKEQANNMSRNRYLEHDGKRLTMSEWADYIGIPYNRLNSRIYRGWPLERALKK